LRGLPIKHALSVRLNKTITKEENKILRKLLQVSQERLPEKVCIKEFNQYPAAIRPEFIQQVQEGSVITNFRIGV